MYVTVLITVAAFIDRNTAKVFSNPESYTPGSQIRRKVDHVEYPKGRYGVKQHSCINCDHKSSIFIIVSSWLHQHTLYTYHKSIYDKPCHSDMNYRRLIYQGKNLQFHIAHLNIAIFINICRV